MRRNKLVPQKGDGVLSRRESEVLMLAACGKTNRQIAIYMAISEETVRTHLKRIGRKLKGKNKTHAVAIALIHRHITAGPSPQRGIPLPVLFGLSEPANAEKVKVSEGDTP